MEVLYQLSYAGVLMHKAGRQKIGAGNGVRTRDPQLGRLMLYQLSYSRTKTYQYANPGLNCQKWWWV
jgi:hypothetical protein